MKTSLSVSLAACISLLLFYPAAGQNLSGIESAVWPLPTHLRADASVFSITDDGRFKTLRQGSNGYFCLADSPDDERFSVACHANSLLPALKRQALLVKTVEDRTVRDSILVSEFKSGSLKIVPGSVSRFISGAINPTTDHPDNVRMWSEISLPYASAESTGLPLDDAGEDPWLMGEGRPNAHVMIRYRSVAWQQMLSQVGARVPE